MELDEYNKVNNTYYTICNIYYDTQDNQLIRHSVSKPRYKKIKASFLWSAFFGCQGILEIKKKVNGLVNKRRTKLTLREAYEFAATGISPNIKVT